MTNKEAIDILKEAKKAFHSNYAKEAFTKAIEALEKEDANDWIYKDLPDPEWNCKFEECEKALGFPLFIWQKTYIIGRGFRYYGATTAEILRDLLNVDEEAINYTRPARSKREKFYRDKLQEIKEKLDASGIPTKPVFFCEKDRENWRRMIDKYVNKPKGKAEEYSEYARFFDEACPGWENCSEYNMLYLKYQQQCANDLLKSKGCLFLNEVYDLLGIPRTKIGAVVGWVEGSHVDFGLFNDRNKNFINGYDRTVLLDFNVDGCILEYLD